ncbi:hypothetical protein EYF80_041863 [Liparis tanakae]|uniref:Uncharacterized protein n=1 Tax=Liparis tanakae TaxID=230148 RepID=A0A4Z2G401_9TELE|nr:hypothetical protein EYF80_041863 [Liparis tanakae]
MRLSEVVALRLIDGDSAAREQLSMWRQLQLHAEMSGMQQAELGRRRRANRARRARRSLCASCSLRG